jgi:hypothetical protein
MINITTEREGYRAINGKGVDIVFNSDRKNMYEKEPIIK